MTIIKKDSFLLDDNNIGAWGFEGKKSLQLNPTLTENQYANRGSGNISFSGTNYNWFDVVNIDKTYTISYWVKVLKRPATQGNTAYGSNTSRYMTPVYSLPSTVIGSSPLFQFQGEIYSILDQGHCNLDMYYESGGAVMNISQGNSINNTYHFHSYKLNHYLITYNATLSGTSFNGQIIVNGVNIYGYRTAYAINYTPPNAGSYFSPAADLKIGVDNTVFPLFNSGAPRYASMNIHDFIVFKNTFMTQQQARMLYHYRSDYTKLAAKMPTEWANRIVHYPFDNNVYDISGNNNHLTAFGGPSFVPITL